MSTSDLTLALSLLGEAFDLPFVCLRPDGRTIFATRAVEDSLGFIPGDADSLVAALAAEGDTGELAQKLASPPVAGASFALHLAGSASRESRGTGRAFEVRAVGVGDPRDPIRLVYFRAVDSGAGNPSGTSAGTALGVDTALGVAHEFNNILTSMLGWAQIALKAVDAESPAAAALRVIESNTRRAKSVAEDLLEAKRPNARRAGPEDAAHLLDEAIRLVSLELDAGKISVVTDFADGVSVVADSGRMLQVLVNLIRNAIDAMPSGGTLQMRSRVDGDFARLEVEDDGVGIPKELVSRVFEPHFTTKTLKRGSTGGSGVGLALSRKIVEDHGGELSLGPAHPRGTIATIRLPRGEMPALPENGDDTSRVPDGVRVLVVDDEPDVGDMIRTALSLEGADVVSAQSGAEAVALCQGTRYDAAFVDFTMAGLSGFDLGRAILEAQPTLPIVFMSGVEIPHDNDPKFRVFLKKPFDLREIRNMLRDAVATR